MAAISIVATAGVGRVGAELIIDRATGPVSGLTYEFTYSCIQSLQQVVVRGNTSSRMVEFEQTMRSSPSDPGAFFTSRFSANLPIPKIAGRGINTRSGEWSATERWYDGDADPVVLATGSWECPDYESLERSVFVPIEPTRVLDTRRASAINYDGATPGAGATIRIPQSALPDRPAGAVAVATNVAIVDAAGPGFVQLLPAGQRPGGSSNVNAVAAGQTVANAAITALGDGGALTLYHRTGGHAIVDVTGYFVRATGATRAGRLTSFQATRVLDTRAASRVGHTGGTPAGGTTLTVDLVGPTSIPSGQATAAVVNVTATNTTRPGYVQAAAGGSLDPGESSLLNVTGAGQTVAGFAIVPMAADGTIDVFTSGRSDLIVDVVGWFSGSTAPSSTSGQFVALPPERIFDTRYSSPVSCCGIVDVGVDGDAARDDLTGRWLPGSIANLSMSGLTEFAQSVFTNVTAVEPMGPGYLQLGAAKGIDKGAWSNLNVTATGQVVANAAVVPVSSERWPFNGIAVHNVAGGHVVIDTAGFFTR